MSDKTVIISGKAHEVLRRKKFKSHKTIRELLEEAVFGHYGGGSKKDKEGGAEGQ